MIQLEHIRNFYPEHLRNNRLFTRFMLKEYLQLMILDHLANTPYLQKLIFIGGTCLRYTKGIDRFSEDLDFDCRGMSDELFGQISNSIVQMLQRNGIQAEIKAEDKTRLKAFRRSIYFPELLLRLGLTGHKTERFLIKIEGQDQGIHYSPESVNIKGCGYFFPMIIPSADILCSMKLSAMLSRAKGRDFYDVIFLLGITKPSYSFLDKRCSIKNPEELTKAIDDLLERVNLEHKMKDCEHILFNPENSKKILRFRDFIRESL